MKKFSFALDRVLAWRRTQQRLEEMKLERIHAELRTNDAQQAALDAERIATNLLPQAGGYTGPELIARDQFRKHLENQRLRLAEVRKGMDKRLDEQTAALTAKRRDVMLLEKIRQRRWEAWNREVNNEIDLQAAESAIFKWTQVQ